MEIKILGTGCSRCRKLFAEAEEAARMFGHPVSVQKVEDIQAIMAFGVRQTPALVLGGQVRSSGRIPAAKEILSWLTEVSRQEPT